MHLCVEFRLLGIASYNIKKLSSLAKLITDRSIYFKIGEDLEELSVFIRYSLDMHATFFPSIMLEVPSRKSFEDTIGNQKWIDSQISNLSILIEYCSKALNGLVSNDFVEMLNSDKKMLAFFSEM